MWKGHVPAPDATVPLLLFDKVIGLLIYLESHHSAVQFDEDRLQLLTAIVGISAGALENTRHLE
ncbi:MAG: GAF domain-containing protein [Pyrinomonadaceae bacterium]